MDRAAGNIDINGCTFAPQGAGAQAIRVVVVDDHPLLLDGICAVMATQPDMELVATGTDGAAAIGLYRVFRPDIMLLDLQMPGIDGLAALGEILGEFPQARVLVLTTYASDGRAARALKAGAAGCLLKNSLRIELLATIRRIHDGENLVDPDILDDGEGARLTARESDVLQLAAAGNSNKQIAARLKLSEDTVKGYMKAIFARLGAMDRTHAVAIAVRRGLIEL